MEKIKFYILGIFKIIRAFLFVGFFLFAIPAHAYYNAGSFPADTVMFTLDSTNNTTCTSSSSVLIPTLTATTTILWVHSDDQAKSSAEASDLHLYCNGQGFPNQFYDTENEINEDIFVRKVCNPGYPITCSKGTATLNNHVWIELLFVPYNIASSTNEVNINNWVIATSSSATSTANIMNEQNDIGKIGYIATTTQISPAETITQATYYVPMYLYVFIGSLILAIVFIVLIFLKITKK